MSNPSLILPQSPAYGEDYVYAAQVEDGAVPLYNVLPLTFTRASGGTRINKDGLVQNMPYNLVQYSEQFDNAYWGKTDSSITTNSTTSPNGTTTADTFTRTINTGYVYNGSFSLAIGQYTQSVYAKANASSSIRLELVTAAFGRGAACIFDLSNGTAGTITIYGGVSGFTASIESVGNGWYRCSLGGTITIADTYYYELSITSGSVYIWGAQLNIGSTAQPYLATTDRLNMPRITYPVGGGCGALLLEKQSTNVNTYSQSINATNYVVSNTTTSENILLSPDGTINATKLIENTSNSSHGIIKFASLGGTVDNSAYCTSVFVKAEGRSRVYFYDNNQAQGGLTYFNLATGSVVSGGGKIENYGNGWYRLTIFCLKDNSTTANIQLYLQDDAGNVTYTGNGTSGIGIYGMQCEASSYATSYIPTTSTSATRIADACYKTGISNLIGQTEGTLFLDVNLTHSNLSGINEYLMQLYQAAGERIILFRNSLSQLNYYFLKGATVFFSSTSIAANGRHKLAFAYKSGDSAFYIDGVQIETNSSTFSAFASLTELHIGANFNPTQAEIGDYNYNNAQVYKTRLTNAELATLTTI